MFYGIISSTLILNLYFDTEFDHQYVLYNCDTIIISSLLVLPVVHNLLPVQMFLFAPPLMLTGG